MSCSEFRRRYCDTPKFISWEFQEPDIKHHMWTSVSRTKFGPNLLERRRLCFWDGGWQSCTRIIVGLGIGGISSSARASLTQATAVLSYPKYFHKFRWQFALYPRVTVYPPLPQILDRNPPSYSPNKTLLEISSVQTAVCGEEAKGGREGECEDKFLPTSL